jgi:hypothetical protein
VADVVAGDDEIGADTSHPLLGAGRLGDECEAQDLACEPSRTSEHAREETRTMRHCLLPSRERPDNGFADRVLASAAKGDAPDFETPAGTGNDTGEVSSSWHPTSHDTTPATAPSPTPHDDERARQSSLFPILVKPSDSSPAERPASDRTAAGEQKTTLKRSL